METGTFCHNVWTLICDQIDEPFGTYLGVVMDEDVLRVTYTGVPIVSFSFDVRPMHQEMIKKIREWFLEYSHEDEDHEDPPEALRDGNFETLSFERLCSTLYESGSWREIVFNATYKYIDPLIEEHFAEFI